MAFVNPNPNLKIPDKINIKEVNRIGAVVTFNGTLQRATLLFDLGFGWIQKLIKISLMLGPMILRKRQIAC
jgi:hypothetical protein